MFVFLLKASFLNKLKLCIVMNKLFQIFLIIFGLFVGGLLLMGVLNICPPQGPWIMPPWCESNQVVSINQDSSGVNNSVDLDNSIENSGLNSSDELNNSVFENNESNKGVTDSEVEVDDEFDVGEEVFLKDFQKGVTFGGMNCSSDSEFFDSGLSALSEFGVEWVVLIPEWFVFPNVNGVEIKPFFDKDSFPNNSGWVSPTLTDAELIDLIHKLKSNGLKIVLKPHLDSIKFGLEEGESRGSFNPSDWSKWFEDYEKFILHYAELSEVEKVDLFVIGTELDTVIREMPNAREKWVGLIKKVREKYSGPITYSVSCFGDCYSPKQVSFWSELDFIGFEPYFGLTNKNNPSVEELKNAFDEKFDKYAKPLFEEYNKPIILTEANVYSYDGVNKHPIDAPPENAVVDLNEQADYYEAMFESITNKNWIRGIYWWGWYLDSTPNNREVIEKNKTDLYDPFVRKPAGKILKKWFKKIKTK